MVQRFNSCGDAVPAQDGWLVTYAAYQKAEAEVKRLQDDGYAVVADSQWAVDKVERLQAIVDCCVEECWWTTENRRRRECAEQHENYCERRKIRHHGSCYRKCTREIAEAAEAKES